MNAGKIKANLEDGDDDEVLLTVPMAAKNLMMCLRPSRLASTVCAFFSILVDWSWSVVLYYQMMPGLELREVLIVYMT